MKELKGHGVKSLNSLVHLRKEALFSISKRTINTERNQNDFVSAVNELPVLCVGSQLSISETSGKGNVTRYSRDGNVFSADNESDCVAGAVLATTSPTTTDGGSGSDSGMSAMKAGLLKDTKVSGAVVQGLSPRSASLTPGIEYELKFTIDLLHGNSKASVFCPHYHRSKVASYWCVVGFNGKVLAMKKIIPSGGRMNEVITVMLSSAAVTLTAIDNTVTNEKIFNPNDKLYMNYNDDYKQLQLQQQQLKDKNQLDRQQLGGETLHIYLISDSIMGLDDVVNLPVFSSI